VGNDDNSPMGGSVVGGSLPARLWKAFMSRALESEGKLVREPEIAPVEVDMEALNAGLAEAGLGLGLDGQTAEPPPPDAPAAGGDAPPAAPSPPQ
jgi:penicillin-binding protein 1A